MIAEDGIAGGGRPEEAVRLSEERYRAILDSLEDGYYEVDLIGNLTFFNDALCEIVGYPPSELAGMNNRQLMDRDNARRVSQTFSRVYTTGRPSKGFDWELMRKDGTTTCIEASVSLIRDARGEPVGFHGIARDISGRKRAEEALQRERDLVSSIMETSPAGITVVNHEGQITFANARAEEVLGLSRDEIVRRTYNAPEWRITDYEGNPFPDEELPFRQVAITEKPVFDVRHAIEWPDGRRVLLSINAAPILDEAGQVDGMVATVEDVTKQMHAEETLRIKESAIASSINAMAMADLEGNLIYVNESFLRMWGYDDEKDVLGQPAMAFWAEKQRATNAVQALWAEGSWMGELLALREDGTAFDTQLSASMVKDAAGRSICMMSSLIDITERKRVELALRESEQKFRSIIERSPDGIMLTDEKGIIIEWNPGAEQITGMSRAEVLNRTLWDVQTQMAVEERRTPAVNELNRKMVRGLLETGGATWLPQLQDTTIQRPDGTRRNVQNLVFMIDTAQGHRLGSILRDITDSRRTDEEIRKLSRAIEQSPSTVVITDTEGKVEYANPRFTQLTGYAIDEILGQTTAILKSGEHDPEFYRQLWETIMAGEEWRDEFANKKKSGEVYWELASISPVRDADGMVTHFVKVAEDITERKRAEGALRQRTAELEARNEELDAFAHTVAHDLQNPLGVIIGFAEALAKDPSSVSEEDLQHYLRLIALHGRKMSNIISELLLLAGVRQTDVEALPLDMASVAVEARQRLADMIEEYQAEIIAHEIWPRALGYGPWVEEIWVNYISNAIKYGGRPPRVELGVDLPSVQESQVRFWVRDNGPGLTPEERARLFVPFTQLAQVHVEGHGLGLSIVRRIVEKLGGEVGVESEGVPGRGSLFFFTLPRASGPTGREQATAHP